MTEVRLIGHNFLGGYNTRKGKAVDKIDNLVQKADENEAVLVLWGIGDHGGGPSKEDIEKIEDYKKAHSELFIKHSFCEEYFSKVDPLKLKTVSEYSCSLYGWVLYIHGKNKAGTSPIGERTFLM